MILETAQEPPYGWWTAPDEKMVRAESAGVIADHATELDILDPEIAEYSVWVYCEECGDVSPALDMIRQGDGAWLCGGCHWGFIREHECQQRYLENIRYV